MKTGDFQKVPEHQRIYQRLHDAILFGELVPGQAVTIQGLSKLADAGATPVREAIRRLISDGALQALGNRRVVVPSLTLGQLEELCFVRAQIEPKLAEMSVKHIDDALIAEITGADSGVNVAIETGSVENYLLHNYRFHFLLYEAANAEILLKIARTLWLRVGPSLRVVCGRYGTANLPDMHDQAIQALRKRDAEGVAEAIRLDIAQGTDQIRRSLC